ncbi:uncharacterized protein LOC131232283 [Magnolia sinica]|uniref:uncharacterized protein LOC131232283 n=1 Tax=Magnolia sinica TaxID=86752 RepID=UPI0026583D30|nr:uncharacterized protein LOC131232283 [Magnolia sinica]
MHWISWKQIAVSIVKGGLGFMRLEEVMKAFRMKMAWGILFSNQSSLWSLFIATKFRLNLVANGVSSHCSFASPLWKCIQAQFQRMLPMVQKMIGEGSCKLWIDNWTMLRPLLNLAKSPIPTELLDMEASFCIAAGLDSFFWPLSPSGMFTIQSVRDACRSPCPQLDWANKLWNPNIPPKISLFAWKLLQNAVPIDEAIQARGVHMSSMCVCCSFDSAKSVETVIHLFVESLTAQAVWDHVGSSFGVRVMPASSISVRFSQWRGALAARRSDAQTFAPLCISWELWKACNATTFEGRQVSIMIVIAKVHGWFRFINGSSKVASSPAPPSLSVSPGSVVVDARYSDQPFVIFWSKLASSWAKINVDGSSRGNLGLSGGGGVCRNERGDMLFVFTSAYGRGSSTGAEI